MKTLREGLVLRSTYVQKFLIKREIGDVEAFIYLFLG